MKKKHRVAVICGLVVMFFYTAGIVRATDFSMKCDAQKCTPATIARFFDEDDLWYPSYSLSNVVTIENKSEDSQFVGHRAFNIQSSEGADIAEVLELVIVRNSVNKQVWKSSLAEFYTTSEAVLGVLGPGKTDSFEYTISMNKNAGNEYQGKKTQFDLVFGYFMPTVTPTPTNTPTPINTPIPTPTSVNPTAKLDATSSGQVQGVSDTNTQPTVLDEIRGKVKKIIAAIIPPKIEDPVVLAKSDLSPLSITSQNVVSPERETAQSNRSYLPQYILFLTMFFGGFFVLRYFLTKRKKSTKS